MLILWSTRTLVGASLLAMGPAHSIAAAPDDSLLELGVMTGQLRRTITATLRSQPRYVGLLHGDCITAASGVIADDLVITTIFEVKRDAVIDGIGRINLMVAD